MSAFGILFRNRNSLFKQYFDMIDEAEENGEKEFNAAVKIQKVWRGHSERKKIKHLNECATVIQSIWRRHLAKVAVAILRQDKISNERMSFYNEMAMKIQRSWRGYYTRTRTFDFYKHQQFIAEQALKNEEMTHMLESYYAETSEIESQRQFDKDCRAHENFAMKNHHLVSTVSIASALKPKPFVKEQPEVPSLEQYIKAVNRSRIVVPSLTPR